ncbi:GPI anchored cell wall protein [Apiospora kogelbergensis]|uniref:GPI anchored cell wall protein n=1 Tax=Apiospora kogelbergensis TaxID=1337665 RepID=A0AAW0QV87_9PEZI
MKLSTLLALPASVSATIRPQQASSRCCFNVTKNGTVGGVLRETQTGDLVFGGTSPKVTLCLDESAGTISDSHGNICSIEEPGHQFKCHSNGFTLSKFELERGLATLNELLTYNGGNAAFVACSVGHRSDGRYSVYSSSKVTTSDCMEVALLAKDQTSGCFAPKNQPVSAPAVLVTTTRTTILGATDPQVTAQTAATNTVPANSTASTSTPPSLTNTAISAISRTNLAASSTPNPSMVASASCVVADSAPSIAPIQIGFPTMDGVSDTSANASITPTNSTMFQYRIPNSFVHGAGKLCALQFRLPFCSMLPSGYPCFSFSGSEQELLSNSGMVFSLVDGVGDISWNNSALQQVYPGTTPIFGTFDCNALPAKYGGDRKISWLASSVNQFSLSFLQAGVGSGSQYDDGVGAWIVACS